MSENELPDYTKLTTGELIGSLLSLQSKRQALSRKDNELKVEMELIKRAVADRFEEEGISSVKSREFGKTVFQRNIFYVNYIDTEKFIKRLEDYGLTHLLSCNRNSLRGYVRELAEEAGFIDENGGLKVTPEELKSIVPDDLAELLDIQDKREISIR
jgi:hypothetical protein